MKKFLSLIRACMTSDMSLFKINGKTKYKSKSSKIILLLFIAFCFMSAVWSYANMLFEPLAPLNLQYVVLSLFVFIMAIFTIVEGIYKTGGLLFNCKDDQLLLSLPIRKSTVLFIRIFKFYVFELLFHTLFMVPLVIAYIRWAKVTGSFFLISFVLLFLLPIIPIIVSCIIGFIITGISSKFKFKNLVQIVVTTMILLVVMISSFYINQLLDGIAKHATSIHDFITKIYYPAGVYAKLVTDFQVKDLLLFIGINLGLFALSIFVLSKIYFKINTNIKSVSTTTKKDIKESTIHNNGQMKALVHKEFNTFFKTPVFAINAGFGIVLYLVMAIAICLRLDSVMEALEESGIHTSSILSNLPVYLIIVVGIGAFTTSITSSMISLEGRGYTILKSLPVEARKVLLSKVIASAILTIPAFIVGDIILFIRLKIGAIEMMFLLLLTILMPLISHFIGLIINLKYPKLDFENSAEVVKQSMSSFLSVTLGFTFVLVLSFLVVKFVSMGISTIVIFLGVTIVSLLADVILYHYLITKGVKIYNSLTV